MIINSLYVLVHNICYSGRCHAMAPSPVEQNIWKRHDTDGEDFVLAFDRHKFRKFYLVVEILVLMYYNNLIHFW